MPVEDLTGVNKFIDDFVNTNPVGSTDTKATLDDHIRGIKNVLLNQFPNLDAAVTSSPAELNKLDGLATTLVELGYVAGVTSAIQTQLDLKAVVDAETFTGLTQITNELRLLAQYSETAVSLGLGGALVCDMTDGTYFYTGVLTSIPTFSFTNLAATGLVSSGIIEINNGLNYAPVWPAGQKWPNSVEPTWTAGKDKVGFLTRDNGTTIELSALSLDSGTP